MNEKAFQDFLARLHPDPEVASEEFLRLRLKTVKYFEFNGFPNADEYADIVIDRSIKRFSAMGDKIKNVPAFVHGVARRVHLETRRKKERERRALAELYQDLQLPSDSYVAELRHFCLAKCLAELPKDRGEIILRYFQSGRGEKGEIAAELNVTENALAQIIFHAKPRLKACIENCLAKNLLK